MKETPKLQMKADVLREYLKNEIKEYLFDELSESYLLRNRLDFLAGVPVPLTPTNLVNAKSEGLKIADIADNMARVMGADTHFAHNPAYVRFLAKCFSEDIVNVFCSKGGQFLTQERFRTALVYFRAALILDPGDQKAVFGYACACRQWYLSMEGEDEEELIAILKKESSDYLEYCIDLFPEFAPAYYYLGYAYLNSGQYTKASFVWKRFLKLNADAPQTDEYKEIEERLADLTEPVKIEAGINELASGRVEKGLQILEPYTKTEYNSWWPLHFYLAEAYRAMEAWDEAIEGYKKVLELSPSNVQTMETLAELYAQLGDASMSEKYYNKAELIRKNNG